ncbi:MAG: hypothetical protein D6812_04750 [Deltaproteobacteria bacterium]|nr:MAG: hypothetical protein D6812_04750 [Deltaproteobacteria bacterium]
MGEYFDAINIRHADRDAVVRTLKRIVEKEGFVAAKAEDLPPYQWRKTAEDTQYRRFLLSPPLNDWIILFFSMSQELGRKYARELSKQLDCPVLQTALLDGEVFRYWFYEGGLFMDEYNSSPNYFERLSRDEVERLRGNPEKLMSIIPEDVSLEDFRDYFSFGTGLEDETEDWEKSSEIALNDGYSLLEKFTAKLGIDGICCYSYAYAYHDGEIESLIEDGFLHLLFQKKPREKGSKPSPKEESGKATSPPKREADRADAPKRAQAPSPSEAQDESTTPPSTPERSGKVEAPPPPPETSGKTEPPLKKETGRKRASSKKEEGKTAPPPKRKGGKAKSSASPKGKDQEKTKEKPLS